MVLRAHWLLDSCGRQIGDSNHRSLSINLVEKMLNAMKSSNLKIAKRKADNDLCRAQIPIALLEKLPLWQIDIIEVTGHNLEARGREEVNRLLGEGWRLLHIYTLKYEEDGVWRERPMAILGRLRNSLAG